MAIINNRWVRLIRIYKVVPGLSMFPDYFASSFVLFDYFSAGAAFSPSKNYTGERRKRENCGKTAQTERDGRGEAAKNHVVRFYGDKWLRKRNEHRKWEREKIWMKSIGEKNENPNKSVEWEKGKSIISLRAEPQEGPWVSPNAKRCQNMKPEDFLTGAQILIACVQPRWGFHLAIAIDPKEYSMKFKRTGDIPPIRFQSAVGYKWPGS